VCRNKAHGGCDRSVGDAYSSYAPDPNSGMSRVCVYLIIKFVFSTGPLKLMTVRYLSVHLNLKQISKMACKRLQKKKYKNNLKSNNYEVCAAVARCFPNILDVMVLENKYYLQILNMKW
jgi:hypothetical protein